MRYILNNFVKTAYILDLLKFAQLNNEQYKQIYSDLRLREKLQDANLEDEFGKSMPLMKEEKIKEKIDELKPPPADEITDPFIKEFLSKNKDNYFDKYFQTNLVKILTDIDYDKDMVSDSLKFFTRKLYTFIEDLLYYNININKVKDFINLYNKFLANKEDLQTLISLCKTFVKLSGYIDAKQEIETEILEKFRKAQEIRKSKIFDFMFKKEPVDFQTQKKFLEMIPQKTEVAPIKRDVTIDYSNDPDATKK